MNTLLRHWFYVALSVLGIVVPALIAKESRPQAAPAPAAIIVPRIHPQKLAAKPQPIETTLLKAVAHEYTCVFAGTAVCDGQPCSNARVEVRVTSSLGEQINHITTGSDGSYQTSVRLIGSPNEILSWEVNAVSTSYQQLNLAGHQILTDEPSIQMQLPLTFAET